MEHAMSDAPLPPLDQVDPAQAWQPWSPSSADPWNLKWAGHLYRRAAFGATPHELRDAVKQGYIVTIRRLLDGDLNTVPAWEKLLADLGEKTALQNNAIQLRGWWLYGVLNTPHPLQEKMVLFWHDHFATSIAKVQRPLLMCRQNVLLRRHALRNFGSLLLEISRDPAMLYWLDSNSNVKGRPNENYARELFELFSLGVGNYSEADIREAARAFTGWAVNGDAYEFDDTLHDSGPKTVLGQRGSWNGDDIVRIVLEQPVAARFLVRKFYRYFITENASPPDSLLQPLAEAFRKSDYDIASVIRIMLSSQHFFSAYAYRQRIKDPVEFAVGALRAAWDTSTDDSASIAPGMLVSSLEVMGQELFAPPNVKGWPGGRSWLNTATVLARHNYTQRITAGHLDGSPSDRVASVAPPVNTQAEEVAPKATAMMAAAHTGPIAATTLLPALVPPPPRVQDSPPPPVQRDIAALVRRENKTAPDQIVSLLLDLLLQNDIPAAARDRLIAFLADGPPGEQAFNRRVRETAHAIMTMPEYQLA
jgi:uncharacterized protein (DUF1800 family)